MTRKRLFAPLVLGLAALAGCQGTTQPAYTGAYDPSMLSYAAGKGAMYTQVVGNPFAASDEALGQAITEAMYGAHFGPRLQFSTERDPQNPSPYRVVFLFNPGTGLSAPELCRQTHQASPPMGERTGGETITVLGAFCAAGDRETSLQGRVTGVSDPNDPAFRRLIREMTTQLFPRRNPDPQEGIDFDI